MGPGPAGRDEDHRQRGADEASAPTRRSTSTRATFLTARLTDFLINDNDRHQGNWKWARLSSGPKDEWEPIARDRDHAFVSFGRRVDWARTKGRFRTRQLRRPAERRRDLMAPSGSRRSPALRPRGDLSGIRSPARFRARMTDSVIDDAVRDACPQATRSSAGQLAKQAPGAAARRSQKAADEFYRTSRKARRDSWQRQRRSRHRDASR